MNKILTDEMRSEVISLLLEGKNVEAIHNVRDKEGLLLGESKKIVEDIIASVDWRKCRSSED